MEKKTTYTSWRIPPEPISESEIGREYSADVIVVGLGQAGTPAVRAAAETGAAVIGIEKMAKEKYNAWGNDVGHINSKFLAGKGVPKVDPIDLFNEWMRRSGNRANPKLVMQFCQKCGEAFDWFTEPFTPEQLQQMRVCFWPLGKHFTGEVSGQKFWAGTAQFPGFSFKGDFRLSDAVVVNQEFAKKLGADLQFGIEAQQLFMNGNRVAGVIAKDIKGQYIKYNAQKGVILAAGDFGSNKEMCADLLDDISDLFDEGDGFSSGGRDGRGIQMGVWVGGRLEARPIATMGGNFSGGGTFGVLWVDENGKRYANEGFGDPVFAGFPSAQEKRGRTAVVFDSTVLETLQYGAPAHMAFFINDLATEKAFLDRLESARKAGPSGFSEGRGGPMAMALYCADTFEELADYAGFKGESKQNFLNTVKHYNELCKAGRDDDFGKDPQLLRALDTPPYYYSGPKQDSQPPRHSRIGSMMCTVGGLMTDEFQNVLNQKKDPIPGLYATGNCCGRRFGLQYSTPIAGVSIGIAMTLGREVGKIVAKL